MEVSIDWKGGMAFEAVPPSGQSFVMDATPESGGDHLGPTPVEALLSATGSCSAMDVISILRKMKQEVTSYRIEVRAERPEGVEYPKPFKSFVVTHILTGVNLEAESVARAVAMSDEKYCSIIATLREKPEVRSEFRIEA
jgi:putative redox protein